MNVLSKVDRSCCLVRRRSGDGKQERGFLIDVSRTLVVGGPCERFSRAFLPKDGKRVSPWPFLLQPGTYEP
jgi:hypothetical protein